jgi:hypothetical protein
MQRAFGREQHRRVDWNGPPDSKLPSRGHANRGQEEVTQRGDTKDNRDESEHGNNLPKARAEKHLIKPIPGRFALAKCSGWPEHMTESGNQRESKAKEANRW